VGGYFGGKLAHAFTSNPDSPFNIFFVARGKHLEAIKKNGLIVKSPDFGSMTCRPTFATERIDELPQIGIFLICVKGYDLVDVATYMRDQIRENTGIMNEIYAIALNKNIKLPEEIIDLSLKKAMIFPRDTQTSLQRDLRQKKGKSELELFGGTIVDLGKKSGIPTPATEKIYRELGGLPAPESAT